jgi:tRNA(Ile)-lysidine synthase
MASIVESHDVRLVRPLLTIPRARLRATLLHAGLDWVEDPSNQDQSALRARLRRALADDTGAGPAVAARTAEAKAFAVSRAATERDTASILAQRVQIFPSGHALLSPGPIAPAALAALIRTVSGGPYPPGTQALARLAANPVPCVIAGVRFLDAGRLGPGLLIVREEAAIEPPIDAIPGILWDRRFYLAASAGGLQGITIGALGADAPRLRGASPLPSAVLITLPALRQNGTLAAVPHIGYPVVGTPARPAFFFSPALPLSGAPFCV